MHGAASVRILNPNAKREALPPRPFVCLSTATRVPRAGRRGRLLSCRPVARVYSLSPQAGRGRKFGHPRLHAEDDDGWHTALGPGSALRFSRDDKGWTRSAPQLSSRASHLARPGTQHTPVILGLVPRIHRSTSTVSAALWILGIKPRMTVGGCENSSSTLTSCPRRRASAQVTGLDGSRPSPG